MTHRRIECPKVQFRPHPLAPLISDRRKNNMSPSSYGVPSTPAFYILFCVATVLVLKEVNSTVWEPYMVSRHINNSVRVQDGASLRLLLRMNRSTSHKAKRTAEANGQRGTQKSRLHRVCESLGKCILLADFPCLTQVHRSGHSPIYFLVQMQVTPTSSGSRSSPHGFANPYIRLRGVSQATSPPIRLDGAISVFDYHSTVPTPLVLWIPFLHRCS